MESAQELRWRRAMRRYNLLLAAGAALLWPLLPPVAAASEKRRRTLLPRLGLARRPPAHAGGPRPLWMHALSVGEVLSAVPLAERLADALAPRPLFFSASTYTGLQLAVRRLARTARAVFYYPYDLAPCVRSAVARVKPALFVLVESDIWPNFLWELHRRRIPAVLVNARLSARSLRGYRRVPSLAVPLFSSFAALCTQSPLDSRRFAALGVAPERMVCTGNLKSHAPAPRAPDPALARIEALVRRRAARRVLVAGSVHRAEAPVLARAFAGLKKRPGDIFFVVVPRDPRKSAAFRRQFEKAGLAFRLPGEPAGGRRQADVLVVDRMGLLRDLYALADVAFVGGSLAPRGGHNPLEPAAHGRPVLFGPDMSDFAAITDRLRAAGGGRVVDGAQALQRAAAALLEDPDRAASAGRAARRVFETSAGALEKTVTVIRGLLS